MSQEVDERVVEMRFDNAQFEKNVHQTMQSLEQLNDSLRLDGAEKGFEKISDASAKVDFDEMQGALDNLSGKFSAVEVMGVAALSHITRQAVDTGERLVKSLSLDQVTSGWNKYAQKTASVQTIMNATGKSIAKVNGYLEKLMWFSDETSYGFTDMTSALSTLTSTGGSIEKMIPMIMGMANATAYAGKGAAEFQRVIYNLAQSYGTGAIQLIDWKSVEQAGVASQQLKQLLIDTGVELGKIKKGVVTTGSFDNSLQKKWADREVMEKAFGKYAEFAEAVKAELDANPNKYHGQASQAIDALADKYDEVTVKAFKAAQEAKSFSEAVDATKDAVSSGWMETFDSGIKDTIRKAWGFESVPIEEYEQQLKDSTDAISGADKASKDLSESVRKTTDETRAMGVAVKKNTDGLIALTTETGEVKYVTVPVSNPFYDKLELKKPVVSIEEDGREIFMGYITEMEKNFELDMEVTCESEFGYLQDRDCLVENKFYTASELLALALTVEDDPEEHVGFKGEGKVFLPGNVTVEKPESDTDKETKAISDCWSVLTNSLTGKYGGYLRLRKEIKMVDGVRVYTRYLDYLAKLNDKTDQVIELGKNLLDISYYIKAGDIVNSVKAYGWYKSGWFFWETTNPISREAYNGESIKKYGLCQRVLVVEGTDSTGDSLLKKATDELKKYSGFTGSVQINAADLCDIGVDTDRLDFMKETYVLAEPHSIDDWLPCTKEVIPLHELDQKDFTFGATTAKLSSLQAGNFATAGKAWNAIQSTIGYINK